MLPAYLAVVGMREIGRRAPHEFVFAVAQHVAELLVDQEVIAFERSVDDADRSLIERGAEALFA